MALQLLPDVEAFLYRYLGTQPDVAALVAGRVYTRIPNAPAFPLLRIVRVAGAPVYSAPLFLDNALVQFDAFGGSSVQAFTLAETVRAALAALPGSGDDQLLVTGVTFGTFAAADDDSYDPPKPRYRFDAFLYVRSA